MTLRSPFFAEFWRHCALSSGNERPALPLHQSEEAENIKYVISSNGDRPTTFRVYSHALVPLRHDWSWSVETGCSNNFQN